MSTYTLQACRIATLPLPGWECFFARNDTSFHDTSFYVWIVRGTDAEGTPTLGLIDTGLPLDADEQRRLSEACQGVDERCRFSDIVTLDKLLEREKIAPDAIDFVAVTQPITYHSGGLVAELLPRARVYIARAGVLEMLLENVGHPPRSFYFTEATWRFLYTLLAEDRLHLVDHETEILPGVVFEQTGGHHPGSAGVRVNTSAGVVGILETAFLQENIDQTLPIGVAENVAACRAAIKRYKAICDVVVADHEPANARRFTGAT